MRDRYLDDIRMHHLHYDNFPENFYKVYHNKKPIDRTNMIAIHNSRDNFSSPNSSSTTSTSTTVENSRQNSIRFTNDLPTFNNHNNVIISRKCLRFLSPYLVKSSPFWEVFSGTRKYFRPLRCAYLD